MTEKYREGLAELIEVYSFQDTIKIATMQDLLEQFSGTTCEISDAEGRHEIDKHFRDPDHVVRQFIKENQDALLTYRGLAKWLTLELANDSRLLSVGGQTKKKNLIKDLARAVMARSGAFNKLILAAMPNHIRLSIHPSSGKEKLSFPLTPQPDGTFGKAPWMSAIAVSIDGRYSTVYPEDVHQTHDLILRDRQPWYFRERHSLFLWDCLAVFHWNISIRINVLRNYILERKDHY